MSSYEHLWGLGRISKIFYLTLWWTLATQRMQCQMGHWWAGIGLNFISWAVKNAIPRKLGREINLYLHKIAPNVCFSPSKPTYQEMSCVQIGCSWCFILRRVNINCTYKALEALLKGTVALDFLVWVFSWMDRPWGMIKVSIFSFPIFGEFSELLVNSVLLPESKLRKVITSLVSICGK